MVKDNLDEYSLTTETEEALLGSILSDGDCGCATVIDYAKSILEPFDFLSCFPNQKPFSYPRTAKVFFAMLQCTEPPNQIRVAWKLHELNIIDEYTRPWYLSYLITRCPTWLNYKYYADTAKKLSIKRKVKYYAGKGDMAKVNELSSYEPEQQNILRSIRTSGRL